MTSSPRRRPTGETTLEPGEPGDTSRIARAAFCAALFLGAIVLAAAPAAAQRAQLTLPKGPYYAGDAIDVQLVVTGFEEEPVPVVEAEVGSGATLMSLGVSPNVSQEITIVNGQMSSRHTVSFVYRYRLTAGSPGNLAFGPFVVKQGAVESTVAAIALTIRPVAASDEIAIELSMPEGPIYVGQHVPVGIRFTLTRELQQSLEDYTLTVPLFSLGGPLGAIRFVDRELDQKAGSVTEIVVSTPQGPVALKGQVAETRLAGRPAIGISLERTMVPMEAGHFEAQAATIVAARATRWRRDLFGQRIPTATNKLRASDRPRALEVRDVPQAGRPASFAGAVGQGFTLDVVATRSVVQVGEPIAVDFVLRGDGALEGAALPPLDAPGLLPADRFRVPADAATGVIEEDGSKRFRVTVRVLDDSVDALPALEYTWFDPETESFETTRSRPIALSVEAGTRIGAEDVVRVRASTANEAAPGDPVLPEAQARAERSRLFDASTADLSIEDDLELLAAGSASGSGGVLVLALHLLGIAFATLGVWAGRRARLDPETRARDRVIEAELARVRGARGSAQEMAREFADALRRLHAQAPDTAAEGLDTLLGDLDAVVYAPPGADTPLARELCERALALAETLVGQRRAS